MDKTFFTQKTTSKESKAFGTRRIRPLKSNVVRILFIVVLAMIGTISYGQKHHAWFWVPASIGPNYSPNGTIAFEDSSETYFVGINKWQWNFGDSTRSTVKNPTHTYALGISTANVCLTVTYKDGVISSNCRQIMVRKDSIPPVNCKANFSDSLGGTIDKTIYFRDLSTSSSPITSWVWNFGDGTYSTLQNPHHLYIYQHDTSLMVWLYFTSKDCSDSVMKYINVKGRDSIPAACKASFISSYQPDSSLSGATYFFTNTSSSNAISYNWSFGDGSGSTLKNPMHTYLLQPGAMVFVRLQITTSLNCTDTFAQTIIIPHNPTDSCYANFNSELLITTDIYPSQPTFRFMDVSRGTSAIAWRQWSLSDSTHYTDSTFIHKFDTTLTSAVVCLTIGTKSGCQSSICQTIILKPSYCHADFSYMIVTDSSKSTSGTKVYFTDLSTSSSPVITRLWNFGDGTYSTLQNPSHLYNYKRDTLMVWLYFRSASGCIDSTFKYIYIPGNTPPYCHADFSYMIATDSSSSISDTKVYFNDLSTSNGAVIYRNWAFGDGTYSQIQNPLHIYKNKQDTSVMVKLYFTSARGCSDSTFKFINLPGHTTSNTFSISGTVVGKNELLPRGTIVLFKKASNGKYSVAGSKAILNGIFRFDKLKKGQYILYAKPDKYYANKYFPTYYVSKLHWSDAQIINLNNSAAGLTLKLISTKSIDKGGCKINGNIAFAGSALKSSTVDSCQVYLLTESGAALSAVTPDESGNFTFPELPYGNYIVTVEYYNLDGSETAVYLSPEAPDANNLQFEIDADALSVNALSKETDIIVHNVSDGQIAIRLSKGGIYTVSLINMTGSIVMNSQINIEANTEKTISIGNLPKGIYILKLQNNLNTLIKKILR